MLSWSTWYRRRGEGLLVGGFNSALRAELLLRAERRAAPPCPAAPPRPRTRTPPLPARSAWSRPGAPRARSLTGRAQPTAQQHAAAAGDFGALEVDTVARILVGTRRPVPRPAARARAAGVRPAPWPRPTRAVREPPRRSTPPVARAAVAGDCEPPKVGQRRHHRRHASAAPAPAEAPCEGRPPPLSRPRERGGPPSTDGRLCVAPAPTPCDRGHGRPATGRRDSRFGTRTGTTGASPEYPTRRRDEPSDGRARRGTVLGRWRRRHMRDTPLVVDAARAGTPPTPPADLARGEATDTPVHRPGPLT